MALPKKTGRGTGEANASAPAAKAELHVQDEALPAPTGPAPGTSVAAIQIASSFLSAVEFDHPVPYSRDGLTRMIRAKDVKGLDFEGEVVVITGDDFVCKVPISRVYHLIYQKA